MKEIPKILQILFHDIGHDLTYIRSTARQIRWLKQENQLSDPELNKLLDEIDKAIKRIVFQIETISTHGIDFLSQDKE